MNTTPTPEREQVAAEVRALLGRGRGRKRVPQTELAAYLKMAQTSLSRRLTGEVPFDVDELAAIARFFSVPLRRLFEGEEENRDNVRDRGRLVSSASSASSLKPLAA